MVYLVPILNALFGWGIISLLFYFLFHPAKKKNFFIVELQGFIPKNLGSWSRSIGDFVSTELVNIPKMKASLLQGDRMTEIHTMLEGKVDDFLRNKLKEKIPVFSMFITEGMISKMKEVLMTELEGMVPSVIDQIATGVEKQFNIHKLLDEKLNQDSVGKLEKIFYQQAGKAILSLKLIVAFLGLLLGLAEILIIS